MDNIKTLILSMMITSCAPSFLPEGYIMRVPGPKIPVTSLKDTPDCGQDSINIAMDAFSIDIKGACQYPKFDTHLMDRGITSLKPNGEYTVSIGPAAFESWSLLASSLAHELEVHCGQNFFIIRVLDGFGYHGTHRAEREAYTYELRNQIRFGHSQETAEDIVSTRDYYYPEHGATENSFMDWLVTPSGP